MGNEHGSGTIESQATDADQDVDDDVLYRPRLCTLKTWSNFDGYGFEMCINDENHVKYVGKIEPRSPAEAAGLKEEDRVIEVNGVNVADLSHIDVFARINEMTDHVTLLVVDPVTEQHYRERDVMIDGQMKQVLRVTCPDVDPAVAAAAGAHVFISANDSDITTTDDVVDAVPVKTDPHQARLCIIRSSDDGSGYGLNILTGHGCSDFFIGDVDPESAAAAGGLRAGDRIIEVNGLNVEQLSHEQLAAQIRSSSNEVHLLVLADQKDINYRRQHSETTTTSDMQLDVSAMTCQDTEPEAKYAHGIRLCQLRMWNEERGYGFNMQTGLERPGQFVFNVDAESPAAAAGLRDGDRIVEVNGDNVEQLTHSEVVDKIKAVSDDLTLLVVDPDADQFFAEQQIAVNSSMDCVERIACSDTKPAASTAENGADKKREEQKEKLADAEVTVNERPVDVMELDDNCVRTSTSYGHSSVELAATVDEARQRLGKKKDVRTTSYLSMKDKHDIFENM